VRKISYGKTLDNELLLKGYIYTFLVNSNGRTLNILESMLVCRKISSGNTLGNELLWKMFPVYTLLNF